MRIAAAVVGAGAALAALSGCTPPQESTVTLAGTRYVVEVRDTKAGRAQGLSGREEVPPGTGMLFRYEDPGPRSFWMSEMLVPIDLAWIAEGRVAGVVTLEPCLPAESCPAHQSPGAVDAVLEVAAGQLADVQPGEPVELDIK